MLVLTRKPGEEVVIGNGIRVRVVSISGKRVRLAFEAPLDMSIHRAEIIDWVHTDSVADSRENAELAVCQ